MDAATLFSSDYATARQRFREAALSLNCELESHSIDQRGPGGEDLAIDVAIAPGARPGRVLVISSGIHGVEGFLGSAVQLGMLREWAGRTPSLPSVRCVLLHALNPFGFAWRRRFNEANVDLNRNLLLEGESFSGSPRLYRALDGLLNPKRVPSRWEPLTLKFLLAIARYGMPALKESVAAGQYDYPCGLFYGGDRPSRTSEILSRHFERWLADSRQVMHLDFHTGLGARANCKLLIDYPLDDAQRERLGLWFGPDSFECVGSHEVGYPVRGSFGRWCTVRNRGRDYLYAAAEFGTYRPTQVLAGLRAENQAQHWGQPEDRLTECAKQRLVELFCPQSAIWRTKVLEHGVQLVHQAIDGLAGEASHQS
ncbi:MAG: DUF2817 domain-containing protein [Betaproteobacteria bacterium]|nr:DUF2817 domain-containing protein [Betaproteobacteria bacterium]